MTVIDISDRLEEIYTRYPEYWCSTEADHELRALWGNPGLDVCNDCGVFVNEETTRIELDGQKQWHGGVHVAAAPNGWHAVSTDYWYAMGGGGSAPSLHSSVAFTTRDEALEAGIRELMVKFEGVRDQPGYRAESQATLAQRMIETLKDRLSQARQLTLL